MTSKLPLDQRAKIALDLYELVLQNTETLTAKEMAGHVDQSAPDSCFVYLGTYGVGTELAYLMGCILLGDRYDPDMPCAVVGWLRAEHPRHPAHQFIVRKRA